MQVKGKGVALVISMPLVTNILVMVLLLLLYLLKGIAREVRDIRDILGLG